MTPHTSPLLRKRIPTALAILAAGTLSMASASAQTTDAAPDQGTASAESSDSQWAIGLAGGINYQVYRDFDDSVRGLPLITYENQWIHVFGPGMDVKLPSLGPVSFRLRGRYIGEGYESDDSPYLEGMSDRDSSVWVGGVATWRTDIVNLSAEVLADVMDNSKGTRTKLQIDRRFATGAFGFTPRLAAEWVDSKYVDYYYGVAPGEVRTWRTAYEGDSTVNAEAGLRIDWRPAPKHAVFLDMGATRMGSTITDSPLVDEDTQYGFGVGYFYRF
ncbi:MipA/OmpV family protein [Franzmannia qiaohouensis]|uniref:MipA/OmpV family protein n=1 Tax=Franzmannia qiaohouensis TaxID=1329370 RepID=A0ABU1HB96_9GAMM|nr:MULTISPECIES: MipA/OmpV family protein [Halomonas]MDR5904144.1 MipA/OmpV family protein [Halomonas qiaohouensis]